MKEMVGWRTGFYFYDVCGLSKYSFYGWLR